MTGLVLAGMGKFTADMSGSELNSVSSISDFGGNCTLSATSVHKLKIAFSGNLNNVGSANYLLVLTGGLDDSNQTNPLTFYETIYSNDSCLTLITGNDGSDRPAQYFIYAKESAL